MAFRFIHTADIHLDSPLKTLALKNEALKDLVGNATRAAFSRIIDLCLEEKVDALLIAGDLYDGDQTSMKTALFLARELTRLDQAGIRCFIIRGNHDAAAKITRELVLPPSVTVFGTSASTIDITDASGQAIAIHGLSFRDSRAPESLLPRYDTPVSGAVNIGMMHTSLNGSAGHDPYAPCSLADLDKSGFRYWALGHIHARSVHQGQAIVVMPGIPQGRDINEAGSKSVTLVTVSDDGSIHLEERPTALATFNRLSIDVTGTHDWADLSDLIGNQLRDATSDKADIHKIMRLNFTGSTALAWKMRRDMDLLRTQADFHAEGLGGVWIEALESRCVPLETKSATSGDPIFELATLIDQDIRASDGFLVAAGAHLADLEKNLPVELRGLLGDTPEEVSARLAALAADGVDDVLARLRTSGEREQA